MPGADTFYDTLAEYLTIRRGQASLDPVGTVILVLTLAAALLSALHLWKIGKQEDRLDRLVALRGAPVDRPARERRPRWYQRLGSIVAASPAVGTAEEQRVRGGLASAGIKGHGSLSGFVASKLCSAFISAALMWLFLEWREWFAGSATIRIAVMLGALMLGWRLPDFILSRLAARRRLSLEQGLPDALDLLVICAEAGLTLDPAIGQVSQDLRASSPAVSPDFAPTASEIPALSHRPRGLEKHRERTG